MTSKERMITALKNIGEPDRVPIYPGLSHLYPLKHTGLPFWQVEYFRKPTMIDAQIALIERFGHDGWFSSTLGASPEEPAQKSEITSQTSEKLIVKNTSYTKHGNLTQEVVYPADTSCWISKGLVEDVEGDYKKILSLFVDPWKRSTVEFKETYRKVGNLGVVELYTFTPFDWWAEMMRRSAQDSIYDFCDHVDTMRKLVDAYIENTLEYIKAACELVRPDFVQFQATSSSISILSPKMFADINMPYIEQAAALCKSYDIPTYVHSGGKSLEMVKMIANTDVSAIGPVEAPPSGDNDLADLKQKYGKKLCFQGNVHTIEAMFEGTPEIVEQEVKNCIRMAAKGGGYILGTGDQTPYDAPEENVIAFIEAGKKYGRYPLDWDRLSE